MSRSLVLVLSVFLLTIGTVEVRAQSLGEVARREAERRRKLEQEGKAGRTITNRDVACHGKNGNVSLGRPEPSRKGAPSPSSGSIRRSLSSFQNRLRSLDGQIRRAEETIALLRERIEKERWGRLSRRGGTASWEERLRLQIRRLEKRLKSLREERREVYDAGRKAGFLPGELDGKGIIP